MFPMLLRRPVMRIRSERNPLYRGLAVAAGCMVALAACAACGAAVLVATSLQKQRHGPGGDLSHIQLGDPAPEFQLYALDESPVSLADLRGAPVAINFWATWCLPCIVEIPALNAAQREYAAEGLVVLAVNVEERPSLVIEFVERRGIEYPVVLDPYALVSDLYGVVGMPTTVWLDGDGIIRAADHGALDAGRIARAMAAVRGNGDAAAGAAP